VNIAALFQNEPWSAARTPHTLTNLIVRYPDAALLPEGPISPNARQD